MGKSYGIRAKPLHIGDKDRDPAGDTILRATLHHFKDWTIWKLRTILRFRWR